MRNVVPSGATVTAFPPSLRALPLALLPLVIVVAGACKASKSDKVGAEEVKPNTGPGLAIDAGKPVRSAVELVWHRESYEAALAEARAKKRPLLLDQWAAWCHACIHMNNNVLIGEHLAAYRDRFVWLAIDREKPENAPVMARFPMPQTPMYYVIDPGSEQILARQIGAISPEDFRAFLDSAEAAFAQGHAGDTLAAARAYRDGVRAAAKGDFAVAETNYQKARQHADKDWTGWPELLLAQVTARHLAGDNKGCAQLVADELISLQGSTAVVGSLAFEGYLCVQELPDQALARRVRDSIIQAVDSSLLQGPGAPIERSLAMQMKRFALLESGDDEAAIAAAQAEKAMLDKAVEGAGSAEETLPYWIPAAEVYAFLELQGEYIPVLQAAVSRLPDRYHLKFLLAQLYMLDGRLEEALAEAERALQVAYGPQKGRILDLLAEIHSAMGNARLEKQARSRAVAFYESLAPGHGQPAELERAREAARR